MHPELSNCCDSIWSDGYLSRERELSVTQPGTAVALLQFILVIPATNATSERLFCATISQKLLAHHDAAGTSELYDVAARSQGMNRCSGHASSANRIHWRVGASVRHLNLQRIQIYLSKMRVTPSVV